MSLVLGIDTSATLAVGLADGGRLLAADRLDDSRAHAERLMPLITGLLAGAGVELGQLTAVAVGMGPGPFTGLRVGIATAQTLAWSLGVECLRVCGLDVLARQVCDEASPGAEFVITADARRRELYWARYAADGTRLAGPEVSAPADVNGELVFGAGAGLYPEVFAGRWIDGPGAHLDAARLAALAGELPDPGPTPLYLRRPDATVPTRRKSTLVVPRARRARG